MAAYKPRLQRDATSARPHQVCSMAFAPQPECPARIASPRRKSVAAPRAKKKTGSHSDTMPTTAKYVKYTFSIMRSPRMSSCAPTGVARFFRRAMCPSSASNAIVATVSPTAVRFAHGPRPNKLTAANPTATRSTVTLFGVHCIATYPNLQSAVHAPTSEIATALPTLNHAKPWLPVTYGPRRESRLFSTSAKPIICRPYHAAGIECGARASDGVATDPSRANAWRAFRVFVGELRSSSNKQNQPVKLE